MARSSGSFWGRWGVPIALGALALVMIGLVAIALGVAVGWIPWR